MATFITKIIDFLFCYNEEEEICKGFHYALNVFCIQLRILQKSEYRYLPITRDLKALIILIRGYRHAHDCEPDYLIYVPESLYADEIKFDILTKHLEWTLTLCRKEDTQKIKSICQAMLCQQS